MSEYFSHDYDCRSDEKIMDLMAEMSWAGYGLFWGIIELLYQNNGTMQTQYKRIAFALGSNGSSVKSIVEDFDLFTIEGDEFWSESVNKRLDERANKSEKARESANKRWDKQRKDANAMRTQCDGNAKKDSIVKESKVNKKIPEFKEFKDYALDNKSNINLLSLELKYKSWVENDWKDGNDNKITNWKTKLLNTLPHLKEKEVSGGGTNQAPKYKPEPLPKNTPPMPQSLKDKFGIK